MKCCVIDGGVEEQSIQLEIVLDVCFLFSFFHFVQWRLRNVDMAALYENGHLTIEECEQQCSYMTSVDVRICH